MRYRKLKIKLLGVCGWAWFYGSALTHFLSRDFSEMFESIKFPFFEGLSGVLNAG
jgi:hypothetical protein